jgi:FkbM family methyltransferase
MINKLKELIKGEKRIFIAFCKTNNLNLDFQGNRYEFGVLKAIFEDREYSDYFPFYRTATIIDIGAHFGYFSIFANNNTNISSKIIAVEPNKSNFLNLEKNIIACGIKNISNLNLAISSKSGLSNLYLGETPNHSLFKDYLLIKDKNRGFEEVKVKTLEDLILENDLDKIDFLKMDCEGAEYEILENTPGYIYDRILTISIEFHDLKDSRYTGENLAGVMVRNGFRIVKFKYEKTSMNLNYGKMIATKLFDNQ